MRYSEKGILLWLGIETNETKTSANRTSLLRSRGTQRVTYAFLCRRRRKKRNTNPSNEGARFDRAEDASCVPKEDEKRTITRLSRLEISSKEKSERDGFRERDGFQRERRVSDEFVRQV